MTNMSAVCTCVFFDMISKCAEKSYSLNTPLSCLQKSLCLACSQARGKIVVAFENGSLTEALEEALTEVAKAPAP